MSQTLKLFLACMVSFMVLDGIWLGLRERLHVSSRS